MCECVRLFYLLLEELNLLCLAVDENLLVIVILLPVAIYKLAIAFVAITFLLLAILLVH